MKTKLIKWLLKLLQLKSFTKDEIKEINCFNSSFHNFFEGGYGYEQVCEYPIPISKFGITDLKYQFKDNQLIVTIILLRPGIIIGKGGIVIIALKEFMNDQNVKIKLEESKLWHYKK